MPPLAFVAVLIVLAMAMVYAMVQFTLLRSRAWAIAYAATWAAIVSWLVVFAGPHPLVFLVPLAYLALHALILWFGAALRNAPAPPPGPLIEEEEEEEEEDGAVIAPPPPRRGSPLGMIAMLVGAILVIGIGENIPALHALDRAVAPYRTMLMVLFIALTVAGFAVFMGSCMALLFRRPTTLTERKIEELHAIRASRKPPVFVDGEISLRELREAWQNGTWRDRRRVRFFLVLIAGVVLMLASLFVLTLVAARPGIKLMAIVVAGYVIARVVIGRYRQDW